MNPHGSDANEQPTLLHNHARYDSFGNTTNSSGNVANPFRFTGRNFDPETGLYYYRARYYEPTTGKFLSEDPLRLYAGVNFYVYVKNQPIDFLDPYGLKCTQKTPWQLIPNMRAPGSPQPYATVEDGVFWTPVGWDFFAGDGTIWCICDWVAHYVRVRKLYRETYKEGAWFKCTGPCGRPEPDQYRTRTVTKLWEKDVPGARLWSDQHAQKLGPTVQLGSKGGTDPNKNNTECLACTPAYRP